MPGYRGAEDMLNGAKKLDEKAEEERRSDNSIERTRMSAREMCDVLHGFVAAAQAGNSRVDVRGVGTTPNAKGLPRNERLQFIRCAPNGKHAGKYECIECVMSTEQAGIRRFALCPDAFGVPRHGTAQLWVHSCNLDDLNLQRRSRYNPLAYTLRR